MVYIDESGEPRFNDEENFVLGAVIINERDWKDADSRIMNLKRAFFGDRDDNYDNHELHMEEIINKKGVYKFCNFQERLDLIRNLFSEINKINLWVVAIILKKQNFRKQVSLETWGYRLLHERLCWCIEELNKKSPYAPNGEFAIMILDSQGKDQDKSVRNKIKKYLHEGTYYCTENDYIIEDPLFTYSNWRSISQITDCIAYVTNKHYQAKKHNNERIRGILEFAHDQIKDKYLQHPQYKTPDGYSIKIWP